MEITNTTVYDQDAVLRFQRFNTRAIKKLPWSTPVIFAFLLISVLTGCVFAVIAKAWLYLALLFLAIYIFVQRLYSLFIAPKKRFKDTSFAGAVQTYTFLKNCFVANVNGEETRVYYEKLFGIWETPAAFYLYANARQAFIVSKDGFTAGTAQELAQLLRTKVDSKKYNVATR